MHTPRQELITSAAHRMRRESLTAHQALEAESGACAAFEAGTLGAAMRQYYLNTSDNALERLIAAVERRAK